MKSVTVFAEDQLRSETLEALCEFVGYPNEICLHPISNTDEFAYGRILSRYWDKAETFCVIEPDIVIRDDVVSGFITCQHGYCAYPYPWTTNVGPALGCTRFRSDFLLRYPLAMKEAVGQRISWRQLDVVLMRQVLGRVYGEQPHVHLPPVVHLNEKKQLLPDADPTPMMEVPLW